ncbi:MAG TPA: glutamine-hydrolyzing carbamoyl-phosphate synthase small subunit [bacterium]|nr:glutamine-hydrolyzing carbamoyl-phosphate synthase small subunit [bacterium]
MSHAYLLLKDDSLYEGEAIGALGISVGEVVFNTSMTGYQEILTDPSYTGQIINFTYPLLGNYGTNREDLESKKPYLRGLILKERELLPSNFRSISSLDNFLARHGVIGISNLDTRMLTRKIRNFGVLPGAIISGKTLTPTLRSRVLTQIHAFSDADVIREASCEAAYTYRSTNSNSKSPKRIVCYDFGIKTNILRCLARYDYDIRVVPHNATYEDVVALKPDGIFLSNGPGDARSIPQTIAAIRELARYYPTFGICLGQQLLALAFGGDIYKLKFGHRGANHPVKDLTTGTIQITSQNHGYNVDRDSLLGTGFQVTHVNLNDGTVEGLQHETLPIFSVQYHPEASPGPQDSMYLFDRFHKMLAERC